MIVEIPNVIIIDKNIKLTSNRPGAMRKKALRKCVPSLLTLVRACANEVVCVLPTLVY